MGAATKLAARRKGELRGLELLLEDRDGPRWIRLAAVHRDDDLGGRCAAALVARRLDVRIVHLAQGGAVLGVIGLSAGSDGQAEPCKEESDNESFHPTPPKGRRTFMEEVRLLKLTD